ncbi:MAG: transcriptional repressor [Candidatus Marinimicrobia bacterium]|nr:transcriptional repressor [Candidatus Neomarinimicrobiota bacterium]
MRLILNKIIITMKLLKETLQKEGLRYTKQRQEIWNELRSSDEHRDAEEIFFTLRKRGFKISRATVYRTIDVLVKNNLIDKLDIGDGRSRFEYNDKYLHHDHLICTSCGKIIEFHNDKIEELQTKIAKQYNFKIFHHSHQLFGICKDCK